MQERTIEAIAADARAAGISIAELCRHAEYDTRNFRRCLNGLQAPRADALQRLALGLKRAKAARGRDGEQTAYRAGAPAELAAYRLSVFVASRYLEQSPDVVMAQDPGKRATCSAEWLAAARARELAIYIAVAICGLSRPAAARAAGMTRQAVHLALGRVEANRDDKLVEQWLAGIEGIFA